MWFLKRRARGKCTNIVISNNANIDAHIVARRYYHYSVNLTVRNIRCIEYEFNIKNITEIISRIESFLGPQSKE